MFASRFAASSSSGVRNAGMVRRMTLPLRHHLRTKGKEQRLVQQRRNMGAGGHWMDVSKVHTNLGEAFGFVCWIWIFHRARLDGGVVLGWRHPWEHAPDPWESHDHGDHGNHDGHHEEDASTGNGTNNESKEEDGGGDGEDDGEEEEEEDNEEEDEDED